MTTITESLRKIENQLFEERDESHDLVGAYLSEDVDKEKLWEMLNNGDVDGIINLLEQEDMYPEDEELDDSVPVATPWECEDEDDYYDDIDDGWLDAIKDDTDEECIDINESLTEDDVTNIVKEIYDRFKAKPEIGKYMLDWKAKGGFDPKVFTKKRNGCNEYDFPIFHIIYSVDSNNTPHAYCVTDRSTSNRVEMPIKIFNKMKSFMKPIMDSINDELSDGINVGFTSRFAHDNWTAWVTVCIPRSMNIIKENLRTVASELEETFEEDYNEFDSVESEITHALETNSIVNYNIDDDIISFKNEEDTIKAEDILSNNHGFHVNYYAENAISVEELADVEEPDEYHDLTSEEMDYLDNWQGIQLQVDEYLNEFIPEENELEEIIDISEPYKDSDDMIYVDVKYDARDEFGDTAVYTMAVPLITDKLHLSEGIEDVTVGIYGDEVRGFRSVDELVNHFTKKGIKVSDVDGDMDYGWEMNLTGDPRQLFFAVVNVIPGYNSDSVEEFIDQYKIDESLNEAAFTPNDKKILAKKLVDVSDNEVENIIFELRSYDKSLYDKFYSLKKDGYSNAAAAKMISDILVG